MQLIKTENNKYFTTYGTEAIYISSELRIAGSIKVQLSPSSREPPDIGLIIRTLLSYRKGVPYR